MFFLAGAVIIPFITYNIVKPSSDEGSEKNNKTYYQKEPKYDRNGKIIDTCITNDSFTREELMAAVRYLAIDRPMKRIHEHDERKSIGIAAVVLIVMAYFYMWCICCRMEDFEKDIQSRVDTFEQKRKKTIRSEALRKIREEIEAKQKMTVEDVELESLKSSTGKPSEKHENEIRDNEERRVVMINTEDLVHHHDEHQPQINIANSVVYITNNSRAPTPDLVSRTFLPP